MAGNLGSLIPAIFTGPNGERLTADQIKRRQEVAQSLLAQATDTSPNAGGWASILAKGVQGFASGMQERNAENSMRQNAEASQSRIAALLGGLTGSTGGLSQGTTVATPTTTPIQNVSAASIPQTADASYIRNGLIERGLPEHVADGFLVNFQDESGLKPGINEANPIVPGSRGGFGLYQLTGPRRVAYEQYAQSRGVAPDNVDAQLDFLKYELEGPEANAAQSILGATDTAGAAQAIVNNFLRPSPEHRQSRSARYATLGGGAPVQAAQAAPVQSAQSAINPSVVEALSSPYASSEEKQIASLLLERQMGEQQQQQKLALAQQQRQQEIARRQAIAQQNGINPAFASDDELWKGAAGQLFAAPSTSTVGSSVIDNRTGKPIYQGTPEATTTQRDYEYYANRETQAGRTPLGPLEYEQALRRSGANNQNISVGGEKFDEQFGSLDAKALSETATAGMAAQRNVGRIDQLEKVLSEVPSGAEANFKQIAGNYGINLGADTSNIQAAQALINSLVPEQRQPGSGPMSDADLELFKQSLPRIINQPGGNQQIINTMRGVAQYDAEGARIVQRLRLPDGDPQKLTRAQAFEALQSRPNPLANFKAPDAPALTPTPTTPAATDGWRDAGNGIRIRPKGGN